MAFRLLLAILLSSAVLAAATDAGAEGPRGPVDANAEESGKADSLTGIYSKCGDSLGCTLWELANVVKQISARDSLDFFSGMFRVKRKMVEEEKEDSTVDASEKVENTDVKEISIEAGAETLADSVERFLETHVVHLAIPDEDESSMEGREGKEDMTYDLANLVPDESRNRGRGKLRRFLIPLLIGFKLKAGFLFPLFFTSVTIIALKALGAGLTALLLSSVLGLKAIVDSSKAPSKLSVEVRPHSSIEHQYHHSHHHVHPVDTHWSPGWGRDGDEQAYKGYYYEDTKN